MQEIINLDPTDYYTQRNNKLYPKNACMPTSRAMFYLGNGIPFHNYSGLSHDDFFTMILSSEKARDLAKEKYPNLSDNYQPYQIHGMYHSYLDPYVVGRRVSDFSTHLTFDDFVGRVRQGQVIMTSGSFPNAGIAGHAFCVIGLVDTKKENGMSLVLADPWGNFHTDYRSVHGYGVRMSKEEFDRHVKPGERKWGHHVI